MSNVNENGSFPPGWYEDYFDPRFVRWWDGVQWTNHVQPKVSSGQPVQNQNVVQPQPQNVQRQTINNLNGSAKRKFFVVFSILAVILIVGIALVFSFVYNFFGFSSRLNDDQVSSLQSILQEDAPRNFDISVDVSGTACEQLCQEVEITMLVPDDEDSYTAADIEQVVRSTIPAYKEINRKLPSTVRYCFETPEGDYPSVSGVYNYNAFASHLVRLFDEINLPRYNSEYYFTSGCVGVSGDALEKY